jgi:hypothetical protein
MRIFILEDDHGRIALFRRWFDGHDITQVDTCAAVGAFQPPYDVVFLDHDLGGRQLEDHEDNGHAFAKLIKGKLGVCPVIVHSFSPDGARNISEELGGPPANCYVAPFLSPLFKSLVSQLTNRQVLR